MKTLMCIIVGLTVLLSSCGGSGAGETGSVFPSGSPEASHAVLLGERELPGAALALYALTEIVPGEEARFRLVIDGTSEPVHVGLRIGSAYVEDGTGSLSIIAKSVAAHTWESSVMMPNSMRAGDLVWARLEMSDGSILESGSSDFGLLK